jgi:hypothetical protein
MSAKPTPAQEEFAQTLGVAELYQLLMYARAIASGRATSPAE